MSSRGQSESSTSKHPYAPQERLGHATAQITLDLYSHVIPGMGADAAVKIAGLLRNAGA